MSAVDESSHIITWEVKVTVNHIIIINEDSGLHNNKKWMMDKSDNRVFQIGGICKWANNIKMLYMNNIKS